MNKHDREGRRRCLPHVPSRGGLNGVSKGILLFEHEKLNLEENAATENAISVLVSIVVTRTSRFNQSFVASLINLK